MIDTLRVYHLLPEEYALDDLRRRRLKVSRVGDMNDPFELLSLSLKIRRDRVAVRDLKLDFDREWGALCFSLGWSNPVLWSHYADKHRGICLGFDVPKSKAMPMSYDARRIELDIGRELRQQPGPLNVVRRLMTTKYGDWRYEREVRFLVSLKTADQEGDLFFFRFGRQLTLREVIVGARSQLSKHVVQTALFSKDRRAVVMKAPPCANNP